MFGSSSKLCTRVELSPIPGYFCTPSNYRDHYQSHRFCDSYFEKNSEKLVCFQNVIRRWLYIAFSATVIRHNLARMPHGLSTVKIHDRQPSSANPDGETWLARVPKGLRMGT